MFINVNNIYALDENSQKVGFINKPTNMKCAQSTYQIMVIPSYRDVADTPIVKQ
jgi:hypothetical protein